MIYISGPITGKTPIEWQNNLDLGRMFAIEMMAAGIPYHSPHLNTWHFEQQTILSDITWQDYIDMDFEIIKRCSGIIMMQGWENSKGAVVERDFAMANSIPVYYSISEIITNS